MLTDFNVYKLDAMQLHIDLSNHFKAIENILENKVYWICISRFRLRIFGKCHYLCKLPFTFSQHNDAKASAHKHHFTVVYGYEFAAWCMHTCMCLNEEYLVYQAVLWFQVNALNYSNAFLLYGWMHFENVWQKSNEFSCDTLFFILPHVVWQTLQRQTAFWQFWRIRYATCF